MNVIKILIKKIYAIPLVWRFIGSIFRPNGVIVLMYHRVGDEQGFFPTFSIDLFEKQMLWVKNNCNIIHPDNFQDGIKNENKFKPNVLITFDDGYRCVYEHAYPILKKLSLPALVFLATQPPDDGGMIWTDFLYFLLHSTSKKTITFPWNLDTFSIVEAKEKTKILSEMKKYLKKIQNADRINFISKLEKDLDVSTASLRRQMLSWDEVRNSLNLVSYGGHTHSHPIMSKISEEELEFEIKHCRERIFQETGSYPISFAYPNGQSTDYSKVSIQLLRKYGYQLAYTTNEGYNDNNTNLMEIKRVPTSAKNIVDFVWLISTSGKN